MTEDRCKQFVYGRTVMERFGGGHQCTRKIWKDSHCRIHHPETVRARQEAREKKWEEDYKNDPLRVACRQIEELKEENKRLRKELKKYATRGLQKS
jgi:hypothetical protein